MKKSLNLIQLVILVSLAACGSAPQGDPSQQNAFEVAYEQPLPEAYLSLLPEGYAVPDRLPATISDPHLMAAWIYIYNQTAAIQIQDGLSLSGRDLALFVIKQDIQVKWGSPETCLGNSCAMREVCYDLECVQDNHPEKIFPILISQRFQDQEAYSLAALAGSLAHELYHHTLPFGPVSISLYEEYFAYYVGTHIAQAERPVFEGHNPETAACLRVWAQANWKQYQFEMDDYPITRSVAAGEAIQVDCAAQ